MEENNQMNIEQQASALKSGVDDLQGLREKQYRQAIHLHEMHSANRKREQERLAKKYGKSDERVISAKRQSKQYAQYGQSLAMQERRTSQAMQTAPKGGFALQGMVVSESKKPQTNLSLGLSNVEGQWLRDIGAACTDENGFYRFSIDAKMVAQYKDQKLVLAVFNENKEVIYRDRLPVRMVPDKTETRNIVLPDKVCQLPQDQPIEPIKELEPKTAVEIKTVTEVKEVKEDPGFSLGGTVTNANGAKAPGVTVKAELVSGKSSVAIGEPAVTGRTGTYKISYTSKDFADLPIGKTMTIRVKCYDAKGTLLGQAEGPQNLDRVTTIDVKLRA